MPNKKLACLIKTTLKILFDFLTLKMKKKKKKKALVCKSLKIKGMFG